MTYDEPTVYAARSFVQRPHKKKDIGEVGIDPEVHGMTTANNMVSPIHNWRPEEPYDYNGSAEKGWGDGSFIRNHGGVRFVQRPHKKRDIGENGIDAEVHGMASANNMVSPIHNWRPDEPYDYNGSAEKGWGDGLPGFAQRSYPGVRFVQKDKEHEHKKHKKDIANSEVRPDVYQVVNDIIDPAPMPRARFAPLKFEDPW